MRAARLVFLGAALALVAGCAAQPMTRASAERLCADEARLADGVAGSVGVGVSSDRGGMARGRLVVTSDVFDPRAEADALEACVARRMAGDRSPEPRRPGFTIALEGSLDADDL
ncbi:MAG: hypothetical protein ACOCYW_01650 [Roseicyclus sp.]